MDFIDTCKLSKIGSFYTIEGKVFILVVSTLVFTKAQSHGYVIVFKRIYRVRKSKLPQYRVSQKDRYDQIWQIHNRGRIFNKKNFMELKTDYKATQI